MARPSHAGFVTLGMFSEISRLGTHLGQDILNSNDFLPILCAGVYRNDRTEILLGIRNPSTNVTHPDTVSSFTFRIPGSLTESIIGRKHPTDDSAPKLAAAADSSTENIRLESRRKRSHDPVYFAVRAMLGYKLNIGEKIDTGEIDFTCRPVSTLKGLVYHEINGVRTVERNLMLYVEVELLKGWEKIPPQSDSYSLLKWIPVEDFLTMYDLRDPTIFSRELDLSRICVKGLCLKIIADTLRGNAPNFINPLMPGKGVM